MKTRRTAREAPPSLRGTLTRALSPEERDAVATDVRRLLSWQESLTSWRAPTSAVDAVPYVALYADGALRGCVGSYEGEGGERLARAFLSAVADGRFGGVSPRQRPHLVAEVSYLTAPRFVDRDALGGVFEAGTHGIGFTRDRGGSVILLPTVARDGQLDAAGMLTALDRKAGTEKGALFVFETERIVVRRREARRREPSASDAAAGWLASLVGEDGDVAFAVDARSGARAVSGEMHHARSAAVIHALREHGTYPKHLALAHRWLLHACTSALNGSVVRGWPDEPVRVAATLALATRAGVDVTAALRDYVGPRVAEVAAVPWHAAQVVAALGASAPAPLWDACVGDLARQPWAPWTLFAAQARGDRAVRARTAKGLVTALGTGPPHEGAVLGTRAAEVAITALTVEALRTVRPTETTSRAIARGQRFIQRCQLSREQMPAPYVVDASAGAFRAAPTSPLLRGDVTGHALLAIL